MATERRNNRREVSLIDDPTPVTVDRQGFPITAGKMAQLFASNSSDPEKQTMLARASIELRGIDPNYVISWIGDESTKNSFRVWCKGKNIRLREETEDTDPHERARRLLAHDEDLISQLSPHLRQIDLARLITLRRYRDADESTQQTIIYGNYRLLGEYLGPRRYYRREVQTPTLLPLPDLPPEIFENEVIHTILLESEREAAALIFNRNQDEGFKYLSELKASSQHPLYREFIEKLERHFEQVRNFSVPGFKDKIAGSQKDLTGSDEIKLSDFPSFHQKEFAFRFIEKPTGRIDYLVGDTGTMKTGAAIYAMEAAGAKSTIVVCPSGINKLQWDREIKEKYAGNVETLTIDSERELRSLAARSPESKPRYIIIGYHLLSRLNEHSSRNLFRNLIRNFGVDSLIADEVHLAKEPTAECTQQLYLLSSMLPQDAARIAMTATALVNSVEDLDSPVRILIPYEYLNQGDFTRAARNNPDLVSALLHGKQIMTRWTKEGLLRLPPIEYRDEPAPFSPFHLKLYEYVYLDDTIEAQVKRGMLRQVSLEPLLVRRHYYPDRIRGMITDFGEKLNERQDDQERRIIAERIRALETRSARLNQLSNYEAAVGDLKRVHERFIEWRSSVNPDEKFDEDFLVKVGYEKLAIWAFFNLRDGVSELVRNSDSSVKEDWYGKLEMYSSKYLKLKELLDDRIKNGREKVIIYSGFYQNEVSTGIEDISEDDELAFLSLYDHLRLWYGDDSFLKIDGSVSTEPKAGELADREKVRRSWRLNPEVNLLATIRSSRLGIDLSVPITEANKDLEKVTVIFLDFPDTYSDVDQGIGRVWRPGQELPVEVIFLRTTNPEQPQTFRYGFIDHGIWESLEFKRLLSQMVLDGVPLNEEEERFVKAHLSNINIELLPITPRAYLNNVFYRQVRGQGAQGVQNFYGSRGFEDMTNADFFAANYPLTDRISLSGHNGRAVSQVIRNFQESEGMENLAIGSIGSGAGILQLTLGKPVVNIDILPEIVEVSRNRLGNQGSFIVGEASQIPVRSEVFDVTDASLMLHWTTNQPEVKSGGLVTSERARVLEELNRVTKINGMVIITLPPSYLTNQQFLVWRDILESHFGFRLKEGFRSGLLSATDFKREPVSWIFNLEKISDPESRLTSVDSLIFDFETITSIIGSRSGVPGQDPRVFSPAVPHSEFEIVEPGNGSIQKLVYRPQDLAEIEEMLLGRSPMVSSGLDILASQGIEEFGTYRRLIREAKNKWHLSMQEAERLARETLTIWAETGQQKYDSQKILDETRSIMEEIREGINK